jgi:hypothetical protein
MELTANLKPDLKNFLENISKIEIKD